MKTIQIKRLFTAALVALAVVSCVNDDEFNTPGLVTIEPELEGEVINMTTLVNLYTTALNDEADDLGISIGSFDYFELKEDFVFELGETTDFVAGYVVNSDESGNWFEELILQDAPENPTTAVRVLVDVSDLFTKYNFGRKVNVKLGGLFIGDSNGVLTLGIGEDLGKIPAPLEGEFLRRSIEVATIVPKEVAIADFSEELELQFISITDLQFLKADVIDNQVTFAAEPADQFDGERTVENCTTGGSFILSTSTFADFKTINLPNGRGTMQGVLSRNFFGDEFNVVINNLNDIDFSSSERCDPEEIAFLDPIDCDDVTNTGADIFFEDFETAGDIETLVAQGWVVENIVNGTTEFFVNGFSGNDYLQVNAFGTGEVGIDTWVLTPEIDLDGTTMDSFEIDVQTNFNNGLGLSVWVTTDYTAEGGVRGASWAQLSDVDVPSGSSSGFGSFESAGEVNTSCVSGTVRFALRYQGSDESGGVTTRYHVDNFRVKGN